MGGISKSGGVCLLWSWTRSLNLHPFLGQVPFHSSEACCTLCFGSLRRRIKVLHEMLENQQKERRPLCTVLSPTVTTPEHLRPLEHGENYELARSSDSCYHDEITGVTGFFTNLWTPYQLKWKLSLKQMMKGAK